MMARDLNRGVLPPTLRRKRHVPQKRDALSDVFAQRWPLRRLRMAATNASILGSPVILEDVPPCLQPWAVFPNDSIFGLVHGLKNPRITKYLRSIR